MESWDHRPSAPLRHDNPSSASQTQTSVRVSENREPRTLQAQRPQLSRLEVHERMQGFLEASLTTQSMTPVLKKLLRHRILPGSEVAAFRHAAESKENPLVEQKSIAPTSCFRCHHYHRCRLDDLGVQQTLKRSMASSLHSRNCVEKYHEQ